MFANHVFNSKSGTWSHRFLYRTISGLHVLSDHQCPISEHLSQALVAFSRWMSSLVSAACLSGWAIRTRRSRCPAPDLAQLIPAWGIAAVVAAVRASARQVETSAVAAGAPGLDTGMPCRKLAARCRTTASCTESNGPSAVWLTQLSPLLTRLSVAPSAPWLAPFA